MDIPSIKEINAEELDWLTRTGVLLPPAPQPTNAQPGSAEKIEVLRQRAERGERLWHPDDFGAR